MTLVSGSTIVFDEGVIIPMRLAATMPPPVTMFWIPSGFAQFFGAHTHPAARRRCYRMMAWNCAFYASDVLESRCGSRSTLMAPPSAADRRGADVLVPLTSVDL